MGIFTCHTLIYLPSLWPSIGIPVVLAATFSIVVGLLINKLWTRFLIVIGVSGWFFGQYVLVYCGYSRINRINRNSGAVEKVKICSV